MLLKSRNNQAVDEAYARLGFAQAWMALKEQTSGITADDRHLIKIEIERAAAVFPKPYSAQIRWLPNFKTKNDWDIEEAKALLAYTRSWWAFKEEEGILTAEDYRKIQQELGWAHALLPTV